MERGRPRRASVLLLAAARLKRAARGSRSGRDRFARRRSARRPGNCHTGSARRPAARGSRRASFAPRQRSCSPCDGCSRGRRSPGSPTRAVPHDAWGRRGRGVRSRLPGAAVLAGVRVAREHFAAPPLDSRSWTSRTRYTSPETEGAGIARVGVRITWWFRSSELGLLGAEQVEGAPDVADVQRFVVLVENKHWCVGGRRASGGADDSNRAGNGSRAPIWGGRHAREYKMHGRARRVRASSGRNAPASSREEAAWPPSKPAPGRPRSGSLACSPAARSGRRVTPTMPDSPRRRGAVAVIARSSALPSDNASSAAWRA